MSYKTPRHPRNSAQSGCAVRANSPLPCHPVLILTFAEVSQHSHESGLANPPRRGPSRRQINNNRSRPLHPPSVLLPVRRAMSGTKSDYRADDSSIITRLLFPTPTFLRCPYHSPRVRRCHPASQLLFCSCTCAHPYPSAASLSCVYPGPSGCCQRSRADGVRALGPHGRALLKHLQQCTTVRVPCGERGGP